MHSSPTVDSDTMRGHNEGSISRRKDGLWQVSVTTQPSGRRRYAYLPATANRDAAKAKLKEMLELRDERAADLSPDSPLGRYLRRWLADAEPSLRPATIRHYRLIVELHLIPALGKVKLSSLTPAQVQAYLGHASERLAPQTVRHHRAVLRRALNVALRWGLVIRNVATLVDVPRLGRTELAVLDPGQVRALVAQTADDRLHALYVLAVTTGLRQAELLGLQWRDLDQAAGRLTVARVLVRVPDPDAVREPGKPVPRMYAFAEPKTDRSRRIIRLSSLALLALKAHWIRQGQERLAAGYGASSDGLVFTTARGYPLNGKDVLDAFHAHLTAAKLPAIRFHDLRHTAATLLLAQGFTLEDVKGLLGHSTITLTSNTYGHVVERRSQQLADGMDLILRTAGGAVS